LFDFVLFSFVIYLLSFYLGFYRIRKKKDLHESKYNESKQDEADLSSVQEEKLLLTQLTAVEKAYEIMKQSLSAGDDNSGNNADGNSLAKLISMMEVIIQKTSDTHSVSSLSSLSNNSSIVSKDTSRDAFAGEARRISTAYTEEQNKLDLMMKIQQTRQRQALQRKLWERNQAKMQLNASKAKEKGDDDDSGEGEEEEEDGSEKVVIPQKSFLGFQARSGYHPDSVRGLTSVPTIAESRDNQRSMALRGLNLGPLKRK
jgi:hypothetical protein